MLTDSFGRTITYLRISLTDRCNLRCVYCMPADGIRWTPSADLLGDDQIVHVVEVAASLGIRKIRLTGGEPLVRPGILDLVRRITVIPGIQDLSLTTNGILLENLAAPLAEAGLKRVNVSLDTLDKDKFKRITRFGDIDLVWKGILAAERAGLSPVKLNAVIVRGLNADELPALARLTIDHPWHVRFIEIMPIGNMQEWGQDFPDSNTRYFSVQEMHSNLAVFNMVPVLSPTGNDTARTFRIPGALGTVGFISPLGDHFCQNCNRLRLTSDGHLRSCLVIPEEVSLRDALRNGEPLERLFLQAIANKPLQHDLLVSVPAGSQLGMSQIGG
ncbi:MAG: GTP 3',8-cyclase MoaA [Anaerolineales bacterium]